MQSTGPRPLPIDYLSGMRVCVCVLKLRVREVLFPTVFISGASTKNVLDC